MRDLLFMSLLLFVVGQSSAQRVLSGSLSGILPADHYKVSGALVVPSGSQLRIEAGSRIDFEPFAGLTVDGSLLVAGTPENPVLFTSSRDSLASSSSAAPEAFDWNGIEFSAHAKSVHMEHVAVRHSVIGINLKGPATAVYLLNVTFEDNGYSSLVRDGKPVPVRENVPFSFSWGESDPSDSLLNRKISAVNANAELVNSLEPSSSDIKRISFSRRVLIWGGLAVMSAGATVLACNLIGSDRNRRLYEEQTDPAWAELYREKVEARGVFLSLGITLSAAGLSMAGLSFLF